MKKTFAILLALALAFSLSIFSFADATSDLQKVVDDLISTVGVEDASAAITDAVNAVTAGMDVENDDVAALLADGASQSVADQIIAALNLEGTDLATTIQDAMSNDFVAFLAGIYAGDVIIEETTVVVVEDTTKPEDKKPIETGASNTVAIAAFAALALCAGAAFVLKKKED